MENLPPSALEVSKRLVDAMAHAAFERYLASLNAVVQNVRWSAIGPDSQEAWRAVVREIAERVCSHEHIIVDRVGGACCERCGAQEIRLFTPGPPAVPE